MGKIGDEKYCSPFKKVKERKSLVNVLNPVLVRFFLFMDISFTPEC